MAVCCPWTGRHPCDPWPPSHPSLETLKHERFENSAGALLRNTVLVALANLPRTIGLGVLNMLTALLCIRFVYPLFFAPSLAALIGSLLVEPMFRPYLQEDAAA